MYSKSALFCSAVARGSTLRGLRWMRLVVLRQRAASFSCAQQWWYPMPLSMFLRYYCLCGHGKGVVQNGRRCATSAQRWNELTQTFLGDRVAYFVISTSAVTG